MWIQSKQHPAFDDVLRAQNETWETTAEKPSWAMDGEVPASSIKVQLATQQETRALVERWQQEMSKYGQCKD